MNEYFFYYIKAFKHYADFKGRARRKEYWSFVLIHLVIYLLFSLISILLDSVIMMILLNLYAIVVFLPSLALSVRRLHDINKGGMWILISLIPIIGVIWLLFLFCKAGDNGSNQYGTDPKAEESFSSTSF